MEILFFLVEIILVFMKIYFVITEIILVFMKIYFVIMEIIHFVIMKIMFVITQIKCKNFLATLLRLASDQPESVARNVRGLIQVRS